MTVSVILAHPYKKSFNHPIFNTVVITLKEHQVKVHAHDLYEEKFDPILTAAENKT
jgi:putative NADPH-quinone reductase